MSDPIKNAVLGHGGFVDGSAWQGVYDALTQDGYRVSRLQLRRRRRFIGTGSPRVAKLSRPVYLIPGDRPVYSNELPKVCHD